MLLAVGQRGVQGTFQMIQDLGRQLGVRADLSLAAHGKTSVQPQDPLDPRPHCGPAAGAVNI